MGFRATLNFRSELCIFFYGGFWFHLVNSSDTKVLMFHFLADRVAQFLYKLNSLFVDEFLVSRETVVLRRWEGSKQKFGFIKRVDKG